MIAGRGKGALSVISSRVKQVSYPGMGPQEISTTIIVFNTQDADQWIPHTGLDDGHSFVIPVSGLYELYLAVSQPSYRAEGGFGNAWSGTGTGSVWIRTNRTGSVLEDNIGKQSWGPQADTDAQFNSMVCGPINRSLLEGDTVEFWSEGSATGVGVRNYDALGKITKLRG